MVGIIVAFVFKTNNSFHEFETKISTAKYCWKINELGKPNLSPKLGMNKMAQTRLYLTFFNNGLVKNIKYS